MSEPLRDYLVRNTKQRSAALLALVEGLTEEEALRDRREGWPTHPHHVGQDGSIAGILHHIAAWKQVCIEVLNGRNLQVHEVSPPEPGFTGLAAWVRATSEEWHRRLAGMSEKEFETPFAMEGLSPGCSPLTLAHELLVHDIEHSSQISYLLESHKCAP